MYRGLQYHATEKFRSRATGLTHLKIVSFRAQQRTPVFCLCLLLVILSAAFHSPSNSACPIHRSHIALSGREHGQLTGWAKPNDRTSPYPLPVISPASHAEATKQAPKARPHISLGHRPRSAHHDTPEALKAQRINSERWSVEDLSKIACQPRKSPISLTHNEINMAYQLRSICYPE
jgi:hypothetical protein